MAEILGMDRRALDRARLSRDRRFDGKFFIAVTSTGIYCRPVCPSPSSKSENVRYYATAAAAEEAGFRPCLRCRPEAAPGSPAWDGTSAVVRRALRLIDEGALDAASVAAFAARLGIGTRHLHRLFVRYVGASPLAVAQTRRLHFAKRLLDDSNLPIIQVAMASGFGSVRRFNEAFRATYRRSPRELRTLRRRGDAPDDGDEVILRLALRTPYDWPALRDALATRAVPGVERVDAAGWARLAGVAGGHALVRVRLLESEAAVELRVSGAPPAALLPLCAAVRRTFDLDADPARIAAAFANDPLLAPLVAARPGLRVPGAWDPFEHAVRALVGSRDEAGALVARFGRRVRDAGDGLTHLFPTRAALASAHLRGPLGALARSDVDFDAGVEDVIAALAALPGFDARRAELVALHAVGDPDAFPIGEPELEARAEAWRPWRAYAAAYLDVSRFPATARRPTPRPARGAGRTRPRPLG